MTRTEKKAATRVKVMAAAKALFEEFGYDAVTIRDVAEQAGLSTGSVFMFVDGKEELFRQAMGREPPLWRVAGWLRGMRDLDDARGVTARQLLVDLFGVDA